MDNNSEAKKKDETLDAAAATDEKEVKEEKAQDGAKKDKKSTDKELKKLKGHITHLENELKNAKSEAESANDKYLRVCANTIISESGRRKSAKAYTPTLRRTV